MSLNGGSRPPHPLAAIIMLGLTVLFDRDHSTAEMSALAHQVLSAWPVPECPPLAIFGVEEFLAGQVKIPAGVVWLIFSSMDAPDQLETLSQFEDRCTPVMLSCTDQTEPTGTSHGDGVLICPPTTTPAVTASMLMALWSQSPTLISLSNELRMIQTQQGGLVEQIGKMDEELRLAAQLQQEFLPAELPRIGDIAFDVLFRPAGYVSGDIYDIQRLDENHLGFFVADAVGHGVPAALLTMYIKRSLHTKKLAPNCALGYEIIQPSEALALLNQDMVARQSGRVRFATACYGIINCATHSMILARAGHPFPILLRADGSTDTVAPEGSLLGVFPDEVFEQTTVDLRPGDRLLVYSDGFELAFPGKEENQPVANDRYTTEFERLRYGPIDKALARLDVTLDAQTGSLNQRDDLTMLCLEVKKNAVAHAA